MVEPKPEPDWKRDFECLDAELTDTMTLATHSHWPAFAVAAALLDKGLIDKEALLKITDAVIGIASADVDPDVADVEVALLALGHFRKALEDLRLLPGEVLPELERHETAAFERQRLRLASRPSEPEEDQG
ncbi:hypothetical protein [Albimonas pacifica]|uniref:hypothetical protein n=1 Tax=Albimonas pacifica TaxID=1114924 RepID=UPI000B898953|nr:hypothetical protein [Albimonas pacifica]